MSNDPLDRDSISSNQILVAYMQLPVTLYTSESDVVATGGNGPSLRFRRLFGSASLLCAPGLLEMQPESAGES